MSNATAAAPERQKRANARPAKSMPNRYPNHSISRVEPALAEPLTALDFAERMHEIGMHWWALIEGLFDQMHTERAKEEPVPKWALDMLKDQGRHNATHEEMCTLRTALGELLRLQEGRPAKTVYEVWGDRATRLSMRHECIADAAPALDHFKTTGKYPQAHIVRVSRQGGAWTSDPALLDTLVGRVHLAGSSVGLTNDDDGFFSIQDETGRQLLLTPEQVAGHPALERMSADDRASMDAWSAHLAARKTLRAAAKDGQP